MSIVFGELRSHCVKSKSETVQNRNGWNGCANVENELLDSAHHNHNELEHIHQVSRDERWERNHHWISIWSWYYWIFQVFVFHQTQIQLHYNSRTLNVNTESFLLKEQRVREIDRDLKWNSESSTLIKWSGASWITTRRTRKNKRKANFNSIPFACKDGSVRIDTELYCSCFTPHNL